MKTQVHKHNVVLVVDRDKHPCTPTTPAGARIAIRSKRATILRYQPFTIMLNQSVKSAKEVKKYTVRIDPGSKNTGLVVIDPVTMVVLWAMTIEHRGQTIHMDMIKRAQQRRSRRSRKCRYRKPRFDNRTRPKGWLPPSLESRVSNIETWVNRLDRYLGVGDIEIEGVSFDTHKMTKPGVKGKGYQQGPLTGYMHSRAYVLARDRYTCQYCGKSKCKLETDHIIPRSQGGSDHHSNLVTSCVRCNRSKSNLSLGQYLKGDVPKMTKINSRAKVKLKDAAQVQAYKNVLLDRLRKISPNVTVSDGVTTYLNRTLSNYPKDHWIDAACVGPNGHLTILDPHMVTLHAKAMGHGNRRMVRPDMYGFPSCKPKTVSYIRSPIGTIRTGDLVKIAVKNPPKLLSCPPTQDGRYLVTGRVTALHIPQQRVCIGMLSVSPKHVVEQLQLTDGYRYENHITTTS